VVYETVKRLHDQATADAAVARVATKTRLDAALKGKRGAAKAVIEAVSGRRRIRAQVYDSDRGIRHQAAARHD